MNGSSLFSKWCSHCSKLQKAETKRLKEEETQRRKERFAEEQNEVLERARQEMLAGPGLQSFPAGVDPISARAQAMTREYLAGQQQPQGEQGYEDTLLLYKVLLTPAAELTEKLY